MIDVASAADRDFAMRARENQQRLAAGLRPHYDFVVKLKGYTWDETSGGKSPTDAELATGSNWDKTVSDIKNTAGVMAVGNDAATT